MKIQRFVFSPIEENTYVISDDSGNCAIIDCGCYDKSENEQLDEYIRENSLTPSALLNTHCHLDHIFGNSYILKKYNLLTQCHKDEDYNRINAREHAAIFGLTMDNPPEPGRYIADNEIVRIGSIELKAIHVPGHSAGTLAFYSVEEGVVFTGDALFSGSIGRTDLPGGDYETLINSIKSRLFSLPAETIVYPGHGSETTIGKEISSNPWFNMT